MQAIVTVLTSTVSERMRQDDDSIDRLHHHVTTLTLIIFAIVVTLHQYVGNPITCWAPVEFTGSHVKYTNSFCWVKNTYFLPFENEIPKEYEQHLRRDIIYYQWTPFIFLAMAIGFYAPNAFWRGLNSKAGVDSDNILESASNFKRAEKMAEKERLLRLITNQMDRFLGNPATIGGSLGIKNFLQKICCLCGKKFGNYLVILYFIMKLLYIGNVFAQLFILNAVLRTENDIFGVEMIQNLIEETPWLNSTIFPKVTMCDFFVRKLGNVQRYTVQCLLPVNLYTERMFLFLWFWMLFLMLMSILSLGVWILRAALITDRYSFIEAKLSTMDRIDRDKKLDRKRCLEFVRIYLRQDGVFVLRLILQNTNGITASEIIASVWDSWLANKKPAGMFDEPNETEMEDLDAKKRNGPQKPTAPPKPPKPPLPFHLAPDGASEKAPIYPSAPSGPPSYH